MKSFFEKISTKLVLVILALLFIWFNLMLNQFLSKDHALDLKFAYTAEQAYLSIGQLSFDQRKLYRFGIWALDMPYLLVYSIFLSGILYRLWGIRKIVFLPFVAAFFDLFENLMILRILKVFPRHEDFLAICASVCTSLKWISVLFIFLGIVIGLFKTLYFRQTVPFNSNNIKS
ncbi:hypothetical protein DFQ04_1357 [Algoriphagus boseongensis]|uniref:Uncharacterized protein n=1 Tax=Algoriphagus boseongensis TaxID=1442587 RepID=A0A4R6TDM4_9BACT|nr:hypothetical protein [Algoriphagus boseongensis]TDQ19534.1 hypothetical protein DFQ04_1357 [Algoriphagus boseongensis]